MQKWLVQLEDKRYFVIGSTIKPFNKDYKRIAKITKELEKEESAWLKIFRGRAIIDKNRKLEILSERKLEEARESAKGKKKESPLYELPSSDIFIEAYLEELDGRPQKMQALLKEYVLNKRVKNNG